jgi:membrane-associated phospholipid phosphatase
MMWVRRQGAYAEPLAALFLSLLSTVAFAKLGEDVLGRDALVNYDVDVAGWLHAHAVHALTSVMLLVSQFGSTHVVLAVVVTATALLLRRGRRADALLVAVAVAGGELLDALLKFEFARPRPHMSDPLATAHGFSFPSGHAMASLTLYGILAYVLAHGQPLPRVLRIGAAALAIVVAVGLSRVYLGVHYMSDVLAAWTAGLAWLGLCVAVMRTALLRYRGRSLCFAAGCHRPDEPPTT